MGFKDFCKQNDNIKDNSKTVEDLYNMHKDKSQDELLNELFANVQKQKENGTFNYDSLLQMIEKMSPFLTKEQNLKIKELLAKLK